MDASFESQFTKFFSVIDGCEVLDGLIAQEKGQKMADFSAFERKLILEMKTLKVDVVEKVNSKAQKELFGEKDFPLIFGKFDLSNAISKMPNGKDVNFSYYRYAGRHIEKLMRSANKQIESTKKSLGLSSSLGVLIVLNEKYTALGPEGVKGFIAKMLCSRNKDGVQRFSYIDGVLVMQPLYKYKDQSSCDGYKLNIDIILNNSLGHTKDGDLAVMLSSLVKKWINFNGARYEEFSSGKEELIVEEKVPENLQEKVELDYLKNPYLKELSEDELVDYGAAVTKSIYTMFDIGNKGSYTEKEQMIAMKKFIELTEESRIRAFDMKKVIAKLKK